MLLTYNQVIESLVRNEDPRITLDSLIGFAKINDDKEMAKLFDQYFMSHFCNNRESVKRYIDQVKLANAALIIKYFFDNYVANNSTQDVASFSLLSFLEYPDAPRTEIFNGILGRQYIATDKYVIEDILDSLFNYTDSPKEKLLSTAEDFVKNGYINDAQIDRLLTYTGIDENKLIGYQLSNTNVPYEIAFFNKSLQTQSKIILYLISQGSYDKIRNILQSSENSSLNPEVLSYIHRQILRSDDLNLLLTMSMYNGANINEYCEAISKFGVVNLAEECKDNKNTLQSLVNFCIANASQQINLTAIINAIILSKNENKLYNNEMVSTPKYLTILINSLTLTGDYVFAALIIKKYPEFEDNVCQQLISSPIKLNPFDELNYLISVISDENNKRNLLIQYREILLNSQVDVENKDNFSSVAKFMCYYPEYVDHLFVDLLNKYHVTSNQMFNLIRGIHLEPQLFIGYDKLDAITIQNVNLLDPEFYTTIHQYDLKSIQNIFNQLLRDPEKYELVLKAFLPCLYDVLISKGFKNETIIQLEEAINQYRQELNEIGCVNKITE